MFALLKGFAYGVHSGMRCADAVVSRNTADFAPLRCASV